MTYLFATWRTEIKSELLDAQQALFNAQAEHTEAEQALQAASAVHDQFREHIASWQFGRPLATALANRVHGVRDQLRDSTAAAGRARALVEGLRYRVGDLQQALDQLAQLDVIDAPADYADAA